MKKLKRMITTSIILALTLTFGSGAVAGRDVIETPNVDRAIARVETVKHFPGLRVPLQSIKYVLCNGASGTAFAIAPNTYMTAYHVLEVGQCHIDGEPILPIEIEREKDFAIVSAPTRGVPMFRINCHGFTNGSQYFSLGFPGRTMTLRRLLATNVFIHDDIPTHFEKMHLLLGEILHGTSGGPILNENGEVVGMNSAEANHNTLGYSREMGDTHFCDSSLHRSIART